MPTPTAIDYWIILHKPGKYWLPFDGVLYEDPDEAASAMAPCFTPDRKVAALDRKKLASLAAED